MLKDSGIAFGNLKLLKEYLLRLLQNRFKNTNVLQIFLEPGATPLLDGDALCQIARLIHVRALRYRSIVGEQLDGNGI